MMIVSRVLLINQPNESAYRAKQEALRLLEKKNEVLQTIDDKQQPITFEEFENVADSNATIPDMNATIPDMNATIPDIFDDWI